MTTEATTVLVHIVDERGVYLRSVDVSIFGVQPKRAAYDDPESGDMLPQELAGHTRMRIDGAWRQVPDADVPPMPDPAPVYPKLSSLDMLDLFTEAEQLAVVEATLVSAPVKLWYDRLLAAEYITYADPRTDAGLQALVEAGLLTAERKAQIAAAMQAQAGAVTL